MSFGRMSNRWRVAAVAGMAAALVAFASSEKLRTAARKGAGIIAGRLQEQGARATALWIRDHGLRLVQGMSPVDTSLIAPGLYVGGQQQRHGLARMAALGIGATLSLREKTDDRARGVALEHHLWLPSVDDTPPTLEQLTQATAFMRQIIEKGTGIYVHCMAGVGRAPTTAAAYLVSTGLTPAEAWALIRRARPFIRPKPIQFEQVDRFYAASKQQAQSIGRGKQPAAI